MLLPSRRLSPVLAALGTAALAVAPGSARAQETSPITATPSLTFSLSFGQKVAFGLGLDFRITGLSTPQDVCSGGSREGAGPYGQITWLNFSSWRFGAGLHGGGEVLRQALAVDGEIGWTYHTRYDDAHPGEHGLQLGVVGIGALSYLGALTPAIEVPVRGVLPLGSPVFSPEMMIGVGVGWPDVFGFPSSHCVTGRPLRVGGRVVLPAVVDGRRRPRHHARLDRGTRASIAGAWREDARVECASVPTFVALARDLAAVGAPCSLVARALDAAGDELRHTLLCSRIAGDHAGVDPLPRLLAPPPPDDADRRDALLRMAIEAWADGCVGEGAASARAAGARADATDPACRAALAAIARDEARHAELGWSVLAHALAAGGSEVGDAIADAIAAPDADPPRADPGSDADPRALRAAGRLPQAAADSAFRDTVRAARTRAARLLLSARGGDARGRPDAGERDAGLYAPPAPR